MNREQCRKHQKRLKGTLTSTTIEVDPRMPAPTVLPRGFAMKNENGWSVVVAENTTIKPRWWWRIMAKVRPTWRKKIKLVLAFV